MIPIVGLTLSIDSLKPVRKGFSIAWYLSIASAVRVKLGTTQRISNIVTPVNVLQRKLPISPLRLFLPPPNLPVNRPQEKAQTITNVQVNKKLVVECIERVETTMWITRIFPTTPTRINGIEKTAEMTSDTWKTHHVRWFTRVSGSEDDWFAAFTRR